MSDEPITDQQRKVLRFIVRFRNENGFPPTYSEIANEFGFHSGNAAADHVACLVKKGYVRRLPGVSRGIQVLREGP